MIMNNCKFYICLHRRLSTFEILDFFEGIYPNRSATKDIAYSRKTLLMFRLLQKHRVNARVFSIEYFVISKVFEIQYYKVHYNRIGSIFIRT